MKSISEKRLICYRFFIIVLLIFHANNTLAIDNTLVGKVICGYQGWFTCYGDGSPTERWNHWSVGTYKSNTGAPAPAHLTFEGYPDVSDYNPGSLFQTGFANLGDGQPSKLFSSFRSDVIDKHFEWMEQYGIDGIALQRFLEETKDGVYKKNRDSIAVKIKRAALKYQRLYYMMYDLSADDTTYFKNDWLHLENDLKITESPYYVTQNGKPVIALWGFGFNFRPNLPENSLAIINWLKKKGYYVIGGVPTDWRLGINDSYSGYASVYQAFNMISPWTVGRTSVSNNTYKSTYMQPDYTYCNSLNIDYQPVIFPGFAWSNWNSGAANLIPRNKGDFMWQQFYNVKNMGIPSIYIAMFDEYDEGTAILKMADSYFAKPTNQYFLTTSADGTYISSDYYMRLAGKATRVHKGLDLLTTNVTIPYYAGPIWFRTSLESGTDAVLRQPNVIESISNVSGIGVSASPNCSVVYNESFHSGLYSIKYTGKDNSTTQSYCSFNAFDVDIPINSNTKLSFWILPLNANGRFVSLDLLLTDGTRLKNMDIRDINGVSMKPSQGRGTINVWTETVCNIGQTLNGKTIDKILVTYDQPSNTEDFSGYIDDIQITSVDSLTTVNTKVYLDSNENILIYPNPVNTLLNFEFNLSELSAVTLEIYNIQGLLVKSFIQNSSTIGLQRLTIDVADVESGIYLIRLLTSKKRILKKIIVSNFCHVL